MEAMHVQNSDTAAARPDRFSFGLALVALLVALLASGYAPTTLGVRVMYHAMSGVEIPALTPWLILLMGAGACGAALTVVLRRGWASRKAAGAIAIVGLAIVLGTALWVALLAPKFAQLIHDLPPGSMAP